MKIENYCLYLTAICLSFILLEMALFFGHLNEIFKIFFEIKSKFNNFIKKLVKNHEVRYPTTVSDIIGGLSKNGFDSSWTDSKGIFCPMEFAPIVTYLSENCTKSFRINHWYCLLCFLIKVLLFKADFCDFVHNFRKKNLGKCFVYVRRALPRQSYQIVGRSRQLESKKCKISPKRRNTLSKKSPNVWFTNRPGNTYPCNFRNIYF